jgi:hypothetical protein
MIFLMCVGFYDIRLSGRAGAEQREHVERRGCALGMYCIRMDIQYMFYLGRQVAAAK